MKIIKIFKDICGVIISLIILLIILQSIIYAKSVITDVKIAIKRCIDVLIPSLFGVMALSQLLLESGLYKKLSLVFYPLSWLLKIPPQLIFVFVLGNIAGYPVGARLLAELVQKEVITKKAAQIMSVFCYNSGPAFVVGTVGIAVFNSVKAGLYIYLSCLITNIFGAVIISLLLKNQLNIRRNCGNDFELLADSLVSAVCKSGKAMLIICMMVVAFSAFLAVIKTFGIFDVINNQLITKTIFTLLEITNITFFTSGYKLMPLLTVLISFGGVCVIMQLKALVKDIFSLKMFLVLRIPLSLLAGGINYLLIKVFNPSIYCQNSVSFVQNDLKNSLFSCICLIFMIIIIFFEKSTGNSKKNML